MNRIVACAIVALSLAACAARRSEPEAVGASCDASADCASVITSGGCALIRLCIAGRCEAVDDAGVPASSVVDCASSER